MRRSSFLLRFLAASGLAIGVVVIPITEGADVGYIEDFALSRDRAEALKQLIPGTEDYYYYHALHHQNQEEFDKVDPLLLQKDVATMAAMTWLLAEEEQALPAVARKIPTK